MDRIRPILTWLIGRLPIIAVALAWFHSKTPRMTWSSIAVAGLVLYVATVAPWRIDLLAYKILCMGAAAVAWYYLCRELLGHNRPSLMLQAAESDGFRPIRPGCQVRYWIGIILQGGGALVSAAIVGLTI